MNTTRLRSVIGVITTVAVAAAVMTGCTEKDTSAGGSGVGKPGKSAKSSAPSKSSSGASSSGGSGAGGSTTTGGAGGKAPAKKPSGGTGGPDAPAPKKPAPKKPCADKPPTPDEVDPDEIALYRTEEIESDGAHLNLILQHGAWGCPGKDTDGPPFVTTGEESRWALDQAAYVSATTPITESTENQRIGVQELVDWIAAHPNSGLVFRYQTGDDGAIHRLDQVFTP